MTKDESIQRKIIEKGIRRYRYLLDNPDKVLRMTDGRWYGTAHQNLTLICGKEGYSGQSTGNIFRLGNSEVKPVEYTIDELKVGKEYYDVESGYKYKKHSTTGQLMDFNGISWSYSPRGYNQVLYMRFVEVIDEPL